MSLSTRYLRNFTLAVGAALTLSACGLFGNDSRYEPVDLTEYQATITPVIHWTASIGKGSGYGFTPVVEGNNVFAATPDGKVSRLNVDTGAIIWQRDLDKDLASGVGVGEGVVAVTTKDGQVVLLDANNGNQRWEVRSSTVATTPPMIANGAVVVRADDFRVQGLNIADGSLLWSYVRAQAELALKAHSRMVSAGESTVLVALPVGRVVALNTQTGRPLWELLASTVKGPSDLDSVADVVGAPIVTGNDICLASYQGNVLCYGVTAKGAQARWSQPFSTATGVDATQSSVLSAGVDGTVTSFSRQDGQVLWSDKTLRNRGLSNPIAYDNHVVVADYEGYAHFYDFNSGALQGRISLGDSEPVVSPLVATPKGILAQTGDGDLVLFGAK